MAESAASSGGGGGGGSGGVATNPFDFGVAFHADTARLLSDIKSAESMVTEAIKRMNLAAVVKVRMEADWSGFKADMPTGMGAGLPGGATKQIPPMGGNVFVEPKPPVERGTPMAPPQAAAMPPAAPKPKIPAIKTSGGADVNLKNDPVLAELLRKAAPELFMAESASPATPAAPVPNGWTDKRTWGFGAVDGGASPATPAAPVPPSNASISNQRLSAEGAELEAKILAANRAARAARAAARAPAAPAAVGDYPHPIGPPRPPGYTVPVGSTGGYPTPIGPTQRTKNQVAKSLFTPKEAIDALNGDSGKDQGFFNNSRTNASALAKMARATIRAGGMMFAIEAAGEGLTATMKGFSAYAAKGEGNFEKMYESLAEAEAALRGIPAAGQAFGVGLDAGRALVGSMSDAFRVIPDGVGKFLMNLDSIAPFSRAIGAMLGSDKGVLALIRSASEEDRVVAERKALTGEDSQLLPVLAQQKRRSDQQRELVGLKGTARELANLDLATLETTEKFDKVRSDELARVQKALGPNITLDSLRKDNQVVQDADTAQKAEQAVTDAQRKQVFVDVGKSTQSDTQTTAITRLRMNGKFHEAILQQNENAFQKELAQYTTNENMTSAEVAAIYAKRRALAEKFTAADLELKKQWKTEEAAATAALDSEIGVASLQRLKQFDQAALAEIRAGFDQQIQARKDAGGEDVAAEVQRLEKLRDLRISATVEQQRFDKQMRTRELSDQGAVLSLQGLGMGAAAASLAADQQTQRDFTEGMNKGVPLFNLLQGVQNRLLQKVNQTRLERLDNEDLTGGNRLLGMQLQGRSERELIEERNRLQLQIDIREAKDRFTDPAQRQRRIDLLTKQSAMRTELEQRGLSQVGTYSEADVGQTLDRLRSFRNWQKPDMSGLLGGVGGAGGGDGTSGGDKEEEVKDKTSHGLLGEIRDAVKGGMIAVAA